MKYKLPADFESDLKTIAERLYSNHAVVMVGAGFSRNACEKYPDWNGLGDLFYSILHPGESMPTGHYWNVMDLADEVAASKGRSELESIVQSRIGEGGLKPSSLHERLLKLPWADVVTTNYDTLLEATIPSLLARRYSVVVSENQLAHAERPRIIKLHGSFPSSRPYILTTDDYRCYPRTHAAFVNTVRQAFLEHTFCLVGFSGDDPNFLSWAGWLRDNLGDYSNPIYLVTMDEPSESRRSLLSRRNIRPLALRKFGRICGNDFASGYRCFFDYIERCRRDPDRWLDSARVLSTGSNSLPLAEVVRKWESERGQYHGKLTVPAWQRKLLSLEVENSECWIEEARNNSDLQLVTDFCYEFFWRLDLALRPVPSSAVSLAETVFHSWRKRLLREEVGYPFDKLFCVLIQLMRVYRKSGSRGKWDSVNRTLKSFVKNAGGTIRDDYYYEIVLSALSRFDSTAVLDALREWDPSEANPLALARAGMCYGMLEDGETASRLLVSAIVAARKASSYTNDRRSLQIESVIIRAWLNSEWKWTNDFGDVHSPLRRDLCDRLSDLRGFDCDISDDLTYFESYFKMPPTEMFSSERHMSFDLGPDRVINKFTRVWQDGYSYVRFCEITGLPVASIAKESYETALRSAVQHDIVHVLSCLRYQSDSKLVDAVLTREALLFLPSVVAESVATQMLNELLQLVTGGKAIKRSRSLDVMLQITSRLMCCNLTSDVRQIAYECLKALFENAAQLPPFSCVQDFVCRLVRSTPIDEMPLAVQTIAGLPPVRLTNQLASGQFSCPAYSVLEAICNRPNREKIKEVFSSVIVTDVQWRRIVSGVGEVGSRERKWFLAAAVLYAELNVLSEAQKRELCEKIVSTKSGSFGADLGEFPDSVIFMLMAPETNGLKEWYLGRNLEKEWFDSNCTVNGCAITGGRSVAIDSLVVAVEKYQDVISEEELRLMFSRIEEEWKNAKGLIEKNDYGTAESYMGNPSLTVEGFARACNIGRLVGKVCECKKAGSFSGRVENLIAEYAKAGAPSVGMLAKISFGSAEQLVAIAPSVIFSLNSQIVPIKVDGRRALIDLLGSDDVSVRKEYARIAMSALSWADPSDAWFALELVRSAENSKLLDIEFVACIFSMVSRWKTYLENCCRNHFADDNVVRDIVYLGQLLEIVDRSGELNEYRKGAIMNMWATIAKPFQFFEVKEAWEFVWSKDNAVEG